MWESWIVMLLTPAPLISADLAVLMECTEPFKWLRQAQLISTFCTGPEKASDILDCIATSVRVWVRMPTCRCSINYANMDTWHWTYCYTFVKVWVHK